MCNENTHTLTHIQAYTCTRARARAHVHAHAYVLSTCAPNAPIEDELRQRKDHDDDHIDVTFGVVWCLARHTLRIARRGI
jgi:hypothetical protein